MFRKKKQLPAKLNICLIGKDFPIQARATDQSFLWPLAKGLVRKGHQVTIISSRSYLGKSEVTRDGVKVFYLYDGYPNLAHLPFSVAVFEKFKSLHLEQKFDLVHSFDKSGILVGQKKDRFGVAVAFDVEATDMSQLFAVLGLSQETVRSFIATAVSVTLKFLSTYLGGDRDLLTTADGIFVTSPQQRLFLERYYLYPDQRIYSVPYGVELNSPGINPDLAPLKAKYHLPENLHLAMAVSEMTVADEVIPLLVAFERVAIKKPNAYMVIVGHGPAFKEVEFRMLSLALASRVILVGEVKDEEMSEWISLCDVFVNVSSRSTGFEPTMIEAMSKKKVIIGSELSAMANVIEDGQDGFLLRPADTESLSHLLVELFSGSIPSMEIGARASDKVSSIFNPNEMVEALNDSYYRILSR